MTAFMSPVRRDLSDIGSSNKRRRIRETIEAEGIRIQNASEERGTQWEMDTAHATTAAVAITRSAVAGNAIAPTTVITDHC